MATKKILSKDNPSNTFVHVVLRDRDNNRYDCVGVLVREDDDMIRVTFTAKDDTVVDYLDINRSEILSMDIVDSSKIEKI